MKILTLGAGLLCMLTMAGPGLTQVSPPEDGNTAEHPPVSDRLEEMSREISRMVVEELQQFLDRELERLRAMRRESQESFDQKLKKNLEQLHQDPDDPNAHYELGVLYDEVGDGANAIIHMRAAERGFLARKDVKGTAEARRNLRHYFLVYGFRPEDFELNSK